MKGRRGFTLVEMLVVISIILLLLALLVVLIRGVVDTARRNRTIGTIHMLDQACQNYKVDFNVFPPSKGGGSTDSSVLHQYLGTPRMLSKLVTNSGMTTLKTRKPPLVEFKADQLNLPAGRANTDPNPPVAIIDAWARVLKYKSPGVHNLNGVDLWSTGRDGVDNSSASSEEDTDDVNNWMKDY